MAYTMNVVFTGRTSQNGLTVYATLTTDLTTPEAAPYRDIALTEGASAVYGAEITMPDDFDGYIHYHTSQVDADSDFTGVTLLATDPVNKVEEMASAGGAFTSITVGDSDLTVE